MSNVLKKITELRLARNWSEYELAQHSNLSQSTISTWYRKNQSPTIASLEKICKGCNISMSQFFAEGEDLVSLTIEQNTVLEHWSKLTDDQRGLLLELANSIHSVNSQ